MAGPPLKLSERVVRTVPLQTAAIQDLLTKLGIGVQSGLDPDADNVVGVSIFAYGDMQVTCNCLPWKQLADAEDHSSPRNTIMRSCFTFQYNGQNREIVYVQVSVMVRIETEKTQRLQFQVTVASSDNTVTSAVKELICQQMIKL